eukprot:14506-Hanusia_phi.AAC.5
MFVLQQRVNLEEPGARLPLPVHTQRKSETKQLEAVGHCKELSSLVAAAGVVIQQEHQACTATSEHQRLSPHKAKVLFV